MDSYHIGADDPRALLTPAQLRCVRLVPHRSKVIAQRLGISHHTVDDHIKQAMQRLGVSSRDQAAEIVARWDRGGDRGGDLGYPQTLVPPSSGIPLPPEPANLDMPGEPVAQWDRVQDAAVQLRYHPPGVGYGQAGGQAGGTKHDPLGTFGRVVTIALGIVVLAAAAVQVGTGFDAIGNFIERNIRH